MQDEVQTAKSRNCEREQADNCSFGCLIRFVNVAPGYRFTQSKDAENPGLSPLDPLLRVSRSHRPSAYERTWEIPRRRFLKGLEQPLALPLLEAMAPPLQALARPAMRS